MPDVGADARRYCDLVRNRSGDTRVDSFDFDDDLDFDEVNEDAEVAVTK